MKKISQKKNMMNAFENKNHLSKEFQYVQRKYLYYILICGKNDYLTTFSIKLQKDISNICFDVLRVIQFMRKSNEKQQEL